jgi:O-antigen biosynthesis protein
MASEMSRWHSRPLISVIFPSADIDPQRAQQAIDSVRRQIYPHWELCICASTPEMRRLLDSYGKQESRLRVTFTGTTDFGEHANAALHLASGDHIALLNPSDLLSEDALFWVAREIAIHPDVDLLFSDEDKIDDAGKRFDPYFKSAWNPALMLSQNAFSHLGVYRRGIVEQAGGFRKGYEGSQDYDLVLRCAAKTTRERIRHIPRVLYHWRAAASAAAADRDAKPDAWQAGRLAITAYLQTAGLKADVKRSLEGYYQVEYDAPDAPPLVSVLVPSTLSNATAADCLHSVLKRSTYQNFELVVMARSDHLSRANQDPKFAPLLADRRVQPVEYQATAFNYSRVSNLGARAARGSLLCFLNDDVEVITADWLERLVARVTLDGVGASGPMLYYPSNTIQHAGVLLGAGGVADHAFKRRRRGYGGYFGRAALEQDYSCLTAACLLVRRTTFEEAGGFDETLPVAFNDVDLCIRIRRSGARIVWTPTVEMYHHESFTLGHHDSAQRRGEFLHAVMAMRERWKDVLEADPCYNPNLSLLRGATFALAWPPRMPTALEIVSSPAITSISRTSTLISAGA